MSHLHCAQTALLQAFHTCNHGIGSVQLNDWQVTQTEYISIEYHVVLSKPKH